MKLVPYTNPTSKPQHVGNTTVQPSQTRMIEEHLLPKSAPLFLPDAFLARPMKAIEPELSACTPHQLQQLHDCESQGSQRKGVLEAICLEIIAQEKQSELDDFAGALKDHSAIELENLMLTLANDETKRSMVEAELSTR